MLLTLSAAGALAIAAPAVGYAVGSVDSKIASRPHDALERPDWVAGNESLTDVRLDDNDNDDVGDDNDDGIGNDNDVDTDAAPDGGVDPNPNNNDPNNNGDGNSSNNGGDNGGGGSDPSSGLD